MWNKDYLFSLGVETAGVALGSAVELADPVDAEAFDELEKTQLVLFFLLNSVTVNKSEKQIQ